MGAIQQLLVGLGAYDEDTIAYRDRVVADGGEIIDLAYIDYCIRHAKAQGWWSSVVHWSSAGFGVKLATGAVESLYSLKGTADATQATSANRPTWSSSGTFGSIVRPVVTFDGTDDHLTLGAGPANDPSQLVIAVVANSTLNPANSGVIYGHRSEATRLVQMTVQGNIDARGQLRGSGNALQLLVVAGAVGTTHEALFLEFDKMGDSHRFQRNNGTAATSTYDFGSETFTATIRTIGGADNGGGITNPHKGNIAETLVIEGTITSGQRSALLERLRQRYALF